MTDEIAALTVCPYCGQPGQAHTSDCAAWEPFPETEWAAENGETWTRQAFLDKLEWEGGIAAMVGWGGAGCFPPSLREKAREVERIEFDTWGDDDGE